MKLYATVTSERASKGQGGNEYIEIDIFVGSRENSVTLARLTVRPLGHEGNGYGLYDHMDTLICSISDQEMKTPEKGEKQKGEGINNCEHRDTTKTVHGEYCLNCHAYL